MEKAHQDHRQEIAGLAGRIVDQYLKSASEVSSPASPDHDLKRLEAFEAAVLRITKPIAEVFQEHLRTLEAQNLGSFEANRRVAVLVQTVADKLRKSFVCTKCSTPARLVCSASDTSKNGVFSFQHGSHTHCGTAHFPVMTLVDRPPRKRKGR